MIGLRVTRRWGPARIAFQGLLRERALASQQIGQADLTTLRVLMDDANARRLQSRDIELAFKAAFTRLGGRAVQRERGRFEIASVPAHVRARANAPVAARYDRVAFNLKHVQPDGLPRAELLAPGHPLHDAVIDETSRQFGNLLSSGTVLVSSSVVEPSLLVGVIEEIVDATNAPVARRFSYAFVNSAGVVSPAGPAPHLDCGAAPDIPAVAQARALPWLADAEDMAKSWIIVNRLPAYLAQVQHRRAAQLAKTRELVTKRLCGESERLVHEAAVAHQKERSGERPKESSESLRRKAVELDHRLRMRLTLLDQQSHMSTKPPTVEMAALVLPSNTLQ